MTNRRGFLASIAAALVFGRRRTIPETQINNWDSFGGVDKVGISPLPQMFQRALPAESLAVQRLMDDLYSDCKILS
jgi:hypothetical protein